MKERFKKVGEIVLYLCVAAFLIAIVWSSTNQEKYKENKINEYFSQHHIIIKSVFFNRTTYEVKTNKGNFEVQFINKQGKEKKMIVNKLVPIK